MAEIYWPRHALRPNNVSVTLNERNLATAPAVSGYTQVVSSGPPIWSITFGNIDIRTETQRRLWRAVSALAEGRRNVFIVPICRGDQPLPSGYDGVSEVTHSDDSPHDDDTPYSQSANSVTVGVAAGAGAVVITLDINVVGTIEPGHYLSIDHRLYIVRGTPSAATVNIWPPLRKAVSAGELVELDNPTCRMRVASDSEMAADFQRLRFGQASVSFIEDLT